MLGLEPWKVKTLKTQKSYPKLEIGRHKLHRNRLCPAPGTSEMFCKWQVASQAISIGGSGESTLSCKKKNPLEKKLSFCHQAQALYIGMLKTHFSYTITQRWDLHIFYEVALLEVSKNQNHPKVASINMFCLEA